MRCLMCGFQLPPNANYCPECGSAAPVSATGTTQRLGIATMPVCPICGGGMEKGFLPEWDHHRASPLIWLAGVPQYGTWNGALDVRDRRGYVLIAYRCVACGHIEFRANDAATK